MKAKILYIDDELDNLHSFKAVFRRSYSVDLAENGSMGLELLQANEYQLIICDQRMPGMSGVEFFTKIKSRYPDPIRIILTGYSDLRSVVQAINDAQIYHYVTKPYEYEAFKLILDKALEVYRLRQENALMARKQLEAQFELLKSQINPHFLFNSLNALGGLIQIDPTKAVRFTHHFAGLYRSVLQLKEQQLISLKEELKLVEDFIKLQQLRFGEALHLEYRISEPERFSIPPFSLQLLIENAIKHNIVSEKQPLTIEINQKEDCLLVRNRIEFRENPELSTGIGLPNIKDRYLLIGLAEPVITNENGWFSVCLPLIPNL
ncbi:MAG: histidine kinase [Bacteroidota bacterium]